MGSGNYLLFAFNRGVVDKSALSRVDNERMSLSAEMQTNLIPEIQGPMSLRPGFQYLLQSKNNLKPFHIPFIYASDDVAILEVTTAGLRVFIEEEPITRVSVASAVANGNFDTDVASWTDADDSGGVSAWETGGYLALNGNGTNYARRRQQVSVASGDQNKEHALTIVIERGDVTLRVGSSAGASDYVFEDSLGKGTYSIAFTPTGDFHIELSANQKNKALVNSINVASASDMLLPLPYGEDDFKYLKFERLFDAIYLWCDGYQQRKIERRGQRSWGVVLFQPKDGPFRDENLTNIEITPSAISGNITLTASQSLFNSEQVGALFRITSVGQRVEEDISSDNIFSDSIRVTGTGNSRVFTIVRAGTWSATITLQRSIGDENNWEDIATYTTNDGISFNDLLSNQIVYYRIGIKTGDYTSGTAELTLIYSLGESSGVVRITDFTSSTSVNAEVLDDLGGVDGTLFWNEGAWSDYRGWPTAGIEFEGRLWHFGRSNQWASISNAVESYDDTIEGDSAPINKNLGAGTQDVVNWAIGLQRLIIGTELNERSNRSTSLDEVLTARNCAIKVSSTRGSNFVQALNLDNDGIFANRTGKQLIIMSYKGVYSTSVFDYATELLNKLSRNILKAGIVRIQIQRDPDTRIWCLLADGTIAVLVFDNVDEVSAWIPIETDGFVEDILIMPGESEDNVYLSVRRTIGGQSKRYFERMALQDDCIGETLNKQADSFIIYDGVATDTIGGLGHLEGRNVIVWADGKDLSPDIDGIQKTYLVNGGQIELDEQVSEAIIGLGYSGKFKSTKLAYAALNGSAINQRKKVYQIGLTLVNTHCKAIKYGPDFDRLDNMPEVEKGDVLDADTIHSYYDEDSFEFGGEWDTDSRVCLEVKAPRPATICSILLNMETND